MAAHNAQILCGGSFEDLAIDDEPIGTGRDPHHIPILDLAVKDQTCQWVLQRALNNAPERPRAVDRVVTALGEPSSARRIVEFDDDLSVRQEPL